MVKIAIVGSGYVGLVSGTCLAEVGHNVICSDVSEEKIKLLKEGKIPIHESGLDDLVEKNVKAKRLTFTTDVSKAIRDSDVIFSAVGTPMGESYEADLTYVKQVAKTFAENLNGYKVFVNKSTVPVGTSDIVNDIIKKITKKEYDVVSNPEFLREGCAVKDFLNPDRIVIGTVSEKARKLMTSVYLPFERNQSPIFFTDIKSSELIKYASNSFLATKISFINEISKFCDKVGADVKEVSKGMGFDDRIGSRFLQAGIGYGGSCFPKDVNALIVSGREKNAPFEILEAVNKVNNEQRFLAVKKLKENIKSLKGKRIALWGLAFKPKTDDVREAPAVYIINDLLKEGAIINAFDPIAEESFKHFNKNMKINYFKDNYDATKDCDALILVTEWDEFRSIDYAKLKKNMKGGIILDGRNIYNSQEVRDNGFKYIGIGKN